MKNIKILFVVPCSPYFPSGIVRVEEFLPYFALNGIRYKVINFYSPTIQRSLHWLDKSIFSKTAVTDFILRAFFHALGIPYRWYRLLQILISSIRYDIVFLQSVVPPAWFSKILTSLNKHVVFDFDDALYVVKKQRTQEIIRHAWKVIAGSHVLYDYAHDYNSEVVLIPSSVPVEKYKETVLAKERYPLRIGWIGGPTTLKNLAILSEPFQALVQKGLIFELLIAGVYGKGREVPEFGGLEIIEIPIYTGDDIPQLVASCDIGIMPLLDEPWERGRCAMKALICMAGGIPVVCSPIGESQFIIRDGENGFLAANSQNWIEILSKLLTEKELRNRVGKAGRLTIEQGYSTEVCFKIIKEKILGDFKALDSRNAK
jgi:glycosyltransferase involved in cell wall biosynthesis